jgi:hypothetical protein
MNSRMRRLGAYGLAILLIGVGIAALAEMAAAASVSVWLELHSTARGADRAYDLVTLVSWASAVPLVLSAWFWQIARRRRRRRRGAVVLLLVGALGVAWLVYDAVSTRPPLDDMLFSLEIWFGLAGFPLGAWVINTTRIEPDSSIFVLDR